MYYKIFFLILLITIISCSNENYNESNKKIIIIQGICSKHPYDTDHWVEKLKKNIKENHNYIDKTSGEINDQIIDFSYSKSDWKNNYLPQDTLNSVNTPINNLEKIYENYPSSEFYIVGHSLGGVIALAGVAMSEKISNQTKSIITISSPIKGIKNTDENTGLRRLIELFACSSSEDKNNNIWDDLDYDSEIIKSISEYNSEKTRVYNIVNKYDLVVNSKIAKIEEKFEAFCFEELDEQFLGLNHSTILNNENISSQLIDLLLENKQIEDKC